MRHSFQHRHAGVLLAALAWSTGAHALGFDEPRALLELSLEQLGDVEVTAASRRATRLTETAASVHVIHGDDLRRLGIRSLPEALRLAPNLHVARINAAGYAVSARGLKTSLSNKLLVMVDGRPVYTPLFAGVLWDMQTVPIEDVERIEVVSGPGAAAWGANAVNGVINVVLRPAAQTDGGFAGGWASEDGHGVSAAQTVAAGERGAVRLYGKHDRWSRSESAAGAPVADGWSQRQAGFRGQWRSGGDDLRVQGEAFEGESSDRPFGAVRAHGHHLLARWTRATGDAGQWTLQGYVDVVDRLDPLIIDDRMTISALEFAREASFGDHRLAWGLGYRHARDESRAGLLARLIPAERTLEWAHAYLQDQIAVSARMTVELGLRLDSNRYTGVEALPTARFAWRGENHTLVWGALSRAVRSPARFDRDVHFPANEPYLIRGGPDFRAETSDVAEFGYRAQPLDWLSVSITGFHHWHDGLRAGIGAPQGGVFISNGVEGRTYGVEGWATARVPGEWEVALGVLELRHRLERMPGFSGANSIRDQGNDPEHQVLLRASRRLGERQQVSLFARHVGALPDPFVPSYAQLDARWSVNAGNGFAFGVGARNLLDERHAELDPVSGLPQSVFGRSLYVDARLEW